MVVDSVYEKDYKFCPTCKNKLVRKLIDRRQLLACNQCGFIFWNNPKPVTSAIIVRDDRVLLIKRGLAPLKDYWVLPGGYIDYEEKPEKAVIRETKEETNLEIEVDKLIGVYQITTDPRGINLDIIYLVTVIGGELRLDEESSEFNYFSPEELPELVVYTHRNAIMDWAKTKE